MAMTEPIDKKHVKRTFHRITRKNKFERYYIITPEVDYLIHVKNSTVNWVLLRKKDEAGEFTEDKVVEFVLLPDEIQNRFIFPNYPFL